ncbi:MAG TPA: type III-A CRISPR-associated protein Csm2 [Spirochaetota bacterium]|nr:type III-A CRISPR-associated protein Csm2 [Spirochaetota bacterium]HOF14613.1 type III-A CRISPR-associated protein Csm2 [Spirochaetota bacterium]HOM87525.1 type III-A CRISPR-associated protein Csm2 [Spirochaetota bacterium]HOR93845.1 type III-A CRISPR-associated protein Csm2 [Spirochaetota bacterium]HOT19586.1 type III-A CRISPR-associated protein Csm2 [Spirochaetota bacterium]
MIEIDEKYLTTEPEAKAKIFKDRGLETSQLRKYYDELKVLEKRGYGKSNDDFQKQILPMVKFMKAKIAYGAGRKVNNKRLVPVEFKDHMSAQIDKINDFNSLRNFLLHYQAIICYFTFLNEFSQSQQQQQHQHQHQQRRG